ncbi:MAG TPA: hypothetical protein VGG29_11485 [Caulobacteraceae bacterium]|jgi:hypothetical protein
MPHVRFLKIVCAAAALAGLTACSQGSAPGLFGDLGRHGRYVGVGIYGPGRQWARLAAAPAAKDEAAAQLVDDQAIIVMSDTDTGEVRACGDLTGYCIGFNPWKQPLAAGQITPIALTAHMQPDDPNLTVEVAPAPRRHRSRPQLPPRTNDAAAPTEGDDDKR